MIQVYKVGNKIVVEYDIKGDENMSCKGDNQKQGRQTFLCSSGILVNSDRRKDT